MHEPELILIKKLSCILQTWPNIKFFFSRISKNRLFLTCVEKLKCVVSSFMIMKKNSKI